MDDNQVIEQNLDNVIIADVSKEMSESYLNYAMSVIVSRALPDVRDGLKPVHRRILFDMFDMGLKSTGSYKKCARIVGDVLGKYHPHGDASVYDATVRLAQDFSLRYPVIAPQGNFGSIDGDPPAAMRYTECKMSKIGEAMLTDINKETVDFGPNYDDSLKEPMVLPAAFPFMLANGSSGIAVGMATNMPPHNLKEICDAIDAIIKNPDITVDELMEYIKGPDFPTGGVICGLKGVKDAFSTGHGKVVVRSVYEIESQVHGHDQIVFTEIPYQVNKAELIKKIDQYRKDNIIPNIASVRDESDRNGIRMVVVLKQGAEALVVLNHLFARTALQSNFNVHNLALVDGRPKVLTLKQMLHYYIKHREEVVTRRTQYDLRKAQERAHILEGLKIGLDNIDEVIAIIKASDNNSLACEKLIATFGLDDIQAQAIIDMKLGRLSHMEASKILDELADLEQKIAYFKELLANEMEILEVVATETRAMAMALCPKDTRLTKIMPQEIGDTQIEDFIKEEEVVVLISHKGFAKRIPSEEYKAQGRSGKGTRTAKLTEGDFVEHMFVASTHDYVLFVTNEGLVYYAKVYEIAEASKYAKGTSIKTLLQLAGGEKITTILNFKEFDDDHFLMMATKHGVVKRTRLSLFVHAKKRGVKGVILDEEDELLQCELVQNEDQVIFVSKNGLALRCEVSNIRENGRSTHGVRGMKLRSGDELAGLVKIDPEKRIMMITEKGLGKQVRFDEFTTHSRGTLGQKIYRLKENTGKIMSAVSVDDNSDIVMVTMLGQSVRVHVKDINIQGRNTMGVIIVKLKSKDDQIVALAATNEEDDDPEEIEEDSAENTSVETEQIVTEQEDNTEN